jgi:hypothetical protein
LDLFQLDVSRIILEEIIEREDTICSLDFLIFMIYRRIWLRATGERDMAHCNECLRLQWIWY